jgi:hypothetical protein
MYAYARKNLNGIMYTSIFWIVYYAMTNYYFCFRYSLFICNPLRQLLAHTNWSCSILLPYHQDRMYIPVDFSLTVVVNKDSMLHTGLLLSSIQSINGKRELLTNCRCILQETNDFFGCDTNRKFTFEPSTIHMLLLQQFFF